MKVKLVDDNLRGQPGLSPFINPNLGWERDCNDHDVCIYTDRLCSTQPIDSLKANYAWIIEPSIINGENYINVIPISNKFKLVFSHHKFLQNKISNFKYIPHGGTWLNENEIKLYNKNKNVSFIFSDKQWNSYHRMRHRVYNDIKSSGVDCFGTGCNNPLPRDSKVQGLKDYRFSIVIENCQEDNYFTEKIIDCFLTGTVPIYLGSPTISDYFDSKGIIQVNDVEQIPIVLTTLTSELYNSMVNAIEINFNKAKDLIHPEKLIQQCLTTL